MALFTDGRISNISELHDYDSGVLDVARAEAIDLDAKLELAGGEIGTELDEFLVRRLGGPSGRGPSVPRLDQIVVTAALKQWHILRTLELVYGDVRGNHVDSRYDAKWGDFRRRARWAATSLFRIGVGLTNQPIPKACPPLIRTESGAQPARTYHVQVAWTNARNEQGTPSDVTVYTTPVGSTLVIGMQPAPDGVVGFNVFLGEAPDQLWRQNTTPLPVASEWVLPPAGVVAGVAPTTGQEPEWFLRNDRVLRRG